MRNFFSYLQLPSSCSVDQMREALINVPDDEYDIHHVLSDEVTLTHYRRVHLQCKAMAVLLASVSEDDDILDKPRWQQRLRDFSILEDQTT